jgi:hypothetical protein
MLPPQTSFTQAINDGELPTLELHLMATSWTASP